MSLSPCHSAAAHARPGATARKRRGRRREEAPPPIPPGRPRARKRWARIPGTRRARTAAAGPFSPRLREPRAARHVLDGRRQLRRQGRGGGAGGEEAAEGLLRLPRDQEGAGRLVGTRPRAPRGRPSPRSTFLPRRHSLPSRGLCPRHRAPGILGARTLPDGGCWSIRGRRDSVEKERKLS